MQNDQQTSQPGSPFEIVNPSKPKKLSAKSLMVIVTVLIFLGISVFIGVYLVQQRTNVAEKAAPATAIFISPGSQTKAPGSNFTFSVNMDTSTNAVTGVDVRLIFNPAVMQVVSLQPGAGVTNLNQTISNTYDNSLGTISYAIFTLDSTKAVTGSGVEVLKVNALVKTGAPAGSSNITFDPATAASASLEGVNVLVSKTQGVLVVSGSGPTATATSAPTATPGPTRTATPTATATGTRTATPTATATATATAEPTNAPTATATTTSQSSPLPIPVTGTDWPTYLGVGLGVLVIIASVALAI